jgi:hypothetical protein
MTPTRLHQITADMPCKTIQVHGMDYLRRYYAGTFKDGSDLWLHEFLSCDGDPHQHSHPFNARSVILHGWYDEETPEGTFRRTPTAAARVIYDALRVGVPSVSAGPLGRPVTVFDWHRIAVVAPDTWTAFIVEPRRLPIWFFRDEGGNLEPARASSRDWWREYGPRGKGKA